MDVSISPALLEFTSPLTKQSTELITITNKSTDTIAFKVKTTAPKLYCVRPNAATVLPGQSVEVSIILLGLKEEPPVDFKCNDKFLIVTLPAPYELEGSVSELWPRLEAEFKALSVSKKIKVKYNVTALEQEEEQPSAAASGVAIGGIPSGSKVSEVLDEKSTEEVSEEDRSKIDALNQKLDSNVASATSTAKKNAPATKQQVAQGSSLPITTIIMFAIIAFIIAWLFF